MASNFTLKNGQVFALAEAAGGVYNSEQIRRVCELADEESAFIKLTEDQRIGFMLAPERLEAVTADLAGVGLTLRPYRSQGPLAPKVCLGELCPLAHQDAMGDGVELSVALLEAFGPDVPVVTLGLNGCEQACVGSAVDDIHIVGEESGYKIAIGGRTREFPQLGQFLTENVTREKLPEVVTGILKVFFSRREGEERISDVMERLGTGVFLETLEGNSGEISLDDEVPVPGGEELGEVPPADALEEDLSLDEELVLDDEVEQKEVASGEEELIDENEPVETSVPEADALLSEEDSLDVPLDGEGASLATESELDDIPLDDIPLDDIPLDDELRHKLDDDEMDDSEPLVSDAPVLSGEVDVDEELKSVESRKNVAREMNSDIDGDLALDGGEEELLLEEVPSSEPVVEASEVEEPDLVEDAPLPEEVLLVEEQASPGSAPEGESALAEEEEPLVTEEALLVDEEPLASARGDGITLDDADLNVAAEEGTLEDVERMRDAIRSEVSMDESLNGEGVAAAPAPSAPLLDFDDVDVAIPDAAPVPAASTEAQKEAPVSEPATPKQTAPEPKAAEGAKPAVRKVMPRLKVKMGETEVRVTLPSGIECAVPLDWLESEGAFEMDVGDQTLSVERSGDMIHFRYGSLALSVPVAFAAA